MRSRNCLISILLAAFLCSNSFAQEAHPSPNQTGWLLEVTNLKGAPPAYQRVRLPGSKQPGDWFGRFGKVEGWQLPPGAQPIWAVRISNRLRSKDKTIRIRVSVLRGEKFMDSEETVATYDLQENETITVKALLDFGVEPFEIRAFRTDALRATQPEVINKTTSVEVIGIEAVASDMPAFKLTVRNLSMSPLEALFVDILNEGRQESTGMPQGVEGRPLALSGESIQVSVPLRVKAILTKGRYAPVAATQQQVVLRSAVFADGTTEGVLEREIQSAAWFQSVKFGRRIELQRALLLYKAAIESTDSISSDGVDKFRSQLEAIELGIVDADLVELQQRFPTHDVKVLKQWVEFGLHLMRREMLDQLARFQPGAHGQDFKAWLITNSERYSNWQARLEPSDTSLP